MQQMSLGDFTLWSICCTHPTLKTRKTPGTNSIYQQLVIHAGADIKSWLCGILSFCLCHLKIPKCLVKSTNRHNSKEHKKSYCLISLLCVSYKILKQLIYTHIETLTNLLLLQKQADF